MQTATTNAKPGNPSWKRRTGDKVHPSGTIVHWDDRDPADPYWQIGITCHRCGQRSYTHKQNVNNPSWHGYCSSCVRTPGLFRTLKGKEKLALGGEVDWEDFDPLKPKRYRVKCPNFTRCGNKEYKKIDASNKNRQPFFCRPCFLEDRRSRMKRAWDAGSGKVVSQNKRSRGRQRGDNRWDRERFKTDFGNIVNRLKLKMSVRQITRAVIAREFQLKGETIGESAVAKRVQLVYGKVSVAEAVELALAVKLNRAI